MVSGRVGAEPSCEFQITRYTTSYPDMYRPPKNVFLLSITSFFSDFSTEMVFSVFPAFFVSVLKTGASSLGLVEGVAEGVSNLIKIYGGKLSDKIQKRKPFIITGYALAVATRPFYVAVGSVTGVVGLRVVDRIGKGLRGGPRDALISLSTPKEQLGQAFGFHRMCDTFGAIAGPLVAYLILRAYPDAFDMVFLSSFIVGVFAVVALFFVKDIVAGVRNNTISVAAAAGFSREFKLYLVALFFLSLGSLPVAVMLLTTQDIGLALASIPLFYMVYNIAYAGFSVAAGKVSDSWGAKNVIRVGYLILVASYVFLGFASNTALLVAGFFVLGLFPALTDGIQRAFAAELTPAETRGGAMGMVNAVAGFGLLFAGIGGGLIWEHVGANYAFAVAGICVLGGVVVLSSTSTRRVA